MKAVRKSFYCFIIIALILLSLLISGCFYPQLPENLASHWGVKGEVDGWMPKTIGLLFVPILSTILFLVFLIVPKMDPKWKNIQKFENYFNGFICVLFLFLFYLHILTLFWNLGNRFNMIQLLSPAFGILFFAIGVLLAHALPNYMIGIRTPWTINSEKVWKKTHEVGGKLFKISGALSLAGAFLPMYAIWFILAPVIVSFVGVMVYSYILFRTS